MTYNWNAQSLLRVELDNPDQFLLIKETLTRIGVASKKDNTLYQSCHLLHKRGQYFLTHFKELFALDGREATISGDDIARRNSIAHMLEQWGLCKVIKNDEYEIMRADAGTIKVIPHKDKKNWKLVPKYLMRSDRSN